MVLHSLLPSSNLSLDMAKKIFRGIRWWQNLAQSGSKFVPKWSKIRYFFHKIPLNQIKKKIYIFYWLRKVRLKQSFDWPFHNCVGFNEFLIWPNITDKKCDKNNKVWRQNAKFFFVVRILFSGVDLAMVKISSPGNAYLSLGQFSIKSYIVL